MKPEQDQRQEFSMQADPLASQDPTNGERYALVITPSTGSGARRIIVDELGPVTSARGRLRLPWRTIANPNEHGFVTLCSIEGMAPRLVARVRRAIDEVIVGRDDRLDMLEIVARARRDEEREQLEEAA